MKLRTLLLLSYAIGVIIVTVVLGFSAYKMIFNTNLVIFTILITLGASMFAFVINYLLMLPAFRSIDRLSKESREIARGEFSGQVEVTGSIETKMLAEDFNEMTMKLDQMFRQIKQGEESRNELIANLSHDIKTPIASIRSFSEAILDGMITTDVERQQYLRTIQRETMRLTDLVDELMDVAAIDKKEPKLEFERVWIDQLLVNVLEGFDVQLKREHRDVHVEIASDCQSVFADQRFLMRILYNLLENALKFSDAGTGIAITVVCEKERIAFRVKDFGMGISKAEQERIFDRLYRVEKSRNLAHGGSGLGLHIAKKFGAIT
ncbi:sensor histidine kinase [Listeria riparia]|uniref:histidine kinase n=1 Tax=Listeria riparia FSL S10-1204 TaxID=1265816 RepID=W7D1T1_9LIST|nr:HAMP domain-containing sensor histidine kinase [Listeria riparia]EUJ43152.1 histidine protein kinase [Listeria riparia FSL S10-1204]